MRIALLRPHKTASSSVHELIKTHFEDSEICPSPFASDFYAGEDIRKYKYFWPHMTYPDYRSLFESAPADHVIITLRKPEDRFVSAYNFFRFRGENKPYPRLHTVDHKLIGLEFEPFFFQNIPALRCHFDNYLTRFLLGNYNEHFHERAEIHLKTSMNKTNIISTLETIKAQKNVSFVDLAAGKVSSNFPAFLIKSKGKIPHKNPSRPPYINHDSLSDVQTNLITDMTRFDRFMYESIDWVDI